MGTYYRWCCDEKRGSRPREDLGPDCPQGGYGIEAGSIPFSAWVVGRLWRPTAGRVALFDSWGTTATSTTATATRKSRSTFSAT